MHVSIVWMRQDLKQRIEFFKQVREGLIKAVNIVKILNETKDLEAVINLLEQGRINFVYNTLNEQLIDLNNFIKNFDKKTNYKLDFF